MLVFLPLLTLFEIGLMYYLEMRKNMACVWGEGWLKIQTEMAIEIVLIQIVLTMNHATSRSQEL